MAWCCDRAWPRLELRLERGSIREARGEATEQTAPLFLALSLSPSVCVSTVNSEWVYVVKTFFSRSYKNHYDERWVLVAMVPWLLPLCLSHNLAVSHGREDSLVIARLMVWSRRDGLGPFYVRLGVLKSIADHCSIFTIVGDG